MVKLFYNSKGQAFDVFKLLIAAVVAIAILALLLPIITNLNIFGKNDPTTEARTVIKSIGTHKANSVTSQEVIFKQGTALNARSISDGSGGLVSVEQICLSAGDFIDDDSWETTDNMRVVRYNGSTSKTVQLLVICDVAEEICRPSGQNTCQNGKIYEYFEDYEPKLDIRTSTSPNTIIWKYASNKGCECVGNDDGQTCCLIAVKKT